MRIEFLGCGEACDPDEPNTSFLLHVGDGHVLFDCGLTTPHLYFSRRHDPEALEAVWLSHFHADHFFGLPLLFLKLVELGRKRELKIIGPAGLRQTCDDLVARAYDSLAAAAGFVWAYHEIAPGQALSLGEVCLAAAENFHHRLSLSVRVDREGDSFFYSGDGIPGPGAVEMAEAVSLAILECYSFEGENPGHNNLAGALDFAQKTGARELALVHARAGERALIASAAAQKKMKRGKIFLPRSGDIFAFS